MSFFQELKRRNVVRVGIAYVLMGWLVLQAADFGLDLIDAPNWMIQAFVLLIALGLPVALFLAWAFELTPEGVKRESEIDRNASITHQTGRKLDRAIILFLALAVVLLLADRFLGTEGGEPVGGRPAAESSTESQAEPASTAAATASGQAAEATPSNDKSIAVLPFADMSQAQDQQWFADGLAEEILNALVKVPDLSVTARTSSFQYRGSSLSIAQIAEELGVAHILEGSIRSGGDRIRVTAQLIRASDGFHLWSETYDRDNTDMISIQEDLARSIASVLETSMDPQALEQMAQVGTRSVEAYQLYLRGVKTLADAFANSVGGAKFRESFDLFTQAFQVKNDGSQIAADIVVQVAGNFSTRKSEFAACADAVAHDVEQGTAGSENEQDQTAVDQEMTDLCERLLLGLHQERLLLQQFLAADKSFGPLPEGEDTPRMS